jgi:hypothetical protein
MEKPSTAIVYQLKVKLDEESRIQFVPVAGGRSYQTIAFPKGTEVTLYVSKEPIKVEVSS